VAIKLKRPEDEEAKVYGNENFGIPKDYTKKQRFSSLKLVFYIVAVAAICVTGYKYYSDARDHFLPEISFDRTNQPLIYNTYSDGIILKTQNGKSYSVGECANDDDLSSVIMSASFGKSVFFLGRSEESESLDLCYYNVNTNSVTTIDSDVTDFKVDSSGRFAVYRKDNELCFSNLLQKYVVSKNVGEYYLSDNNQSIVFYNDDGTAMYTCLTEKDAEPELVDDGITKVISPKNTHTGVYYIKNSKLYYKEEKKPRTMLADEVIDAIMLGNSVYFTTEETYKKTLGNFYVDDIIKEDATRVIPDGAEYIKEIDGLSFFDEEAFLQASDEYEKKLIRDEIREYFSTVPIEVQGFSLYMYSDGDTTRVDTDLLTPKLSYNSCKSVLLYNKYDILSVKRQNLSEVESLEEAIEFSEELLCEIPDSDVYLVKERKKPYIAFEETGIIQAEISLDAKYLYCIKSDEEDEKNTLIRYEVGATSLKNELKITKTVTDFALDGSDSSAVIVFNNNEISLFYEDDLIELSKNSYRDFFFVDGTLYYYDEYDYTKNSGTLKSVRNGKITVVDTNVHDFKVRKYNAVSYIKNYNQKTGSGTLYIKEGKTVKRQDNYVTAIIN